MQVELTDNQIKLNDIIKLWIKKEFLSNPFSLSIEDNIAYISIKNSMIRLPLPWPNYKADFEALVENGYLIKISNTIYECTHM